MSDSFNWPDNYPDPTKHKKQRVYRRVMFLFALMLLCGMGGTLVGMFIQSARMSNNKENIQIESSREIAIPSTDTPHSFTSPQPIPTLPSSTPTLSGQYHVPTTTIQNTNMTFVILQEEKDGQILPLEPSFGRFGNFALLQEDKTFYLWLSSYQNKDLPRQGIEQRLESLDGLLWLNRTDTNLQQVDSNPRKHLTGMRSIVKQNGLYQGWEMYYYESSWGWADAVRYVTSVDGLNWQVHEQPALRGAKWVQVFYINDVYQMWASTNVDLHVYPNELEILRFRISEQPGTNWGDWQDGGIVVTVDNVPINTQYFVRYVNERYEIYYRDNSRIYRAVGMDGHTFLLEEGVLDVGDWLPEAKIGTFAVVTIQGSDRVYFSYYDALGKWGIAVAMPTQQ